MTAVLCILIFVLSVLSGMFGIGVAFAAVPFLSLFLTDLVNQVHPLSLLLNGITAMFALFAFWRAGYVDWRGGTALAVVATVTAPAGAVLARVVPEVAVWCAYFGAAVFVCWQMFRPCTQASARPRLVTMLFAAIPISVLSGLLGVGPGFLLVPVLMMLGIDPKRAAGLNALAVTPASFAAMMPHLVHVSIDWSLAVPLCTAGAIGSVIGAQLASRHLADQSLRRAFGITVAVTTLYRAVRMFV